MSSTSDHVCCVCGKKEKITGLEQMRLQESDGQLYCWACLVHKNQKNRESDPAWHCSMCSGQFDSGYTPSSSEPLPLYVALGGKRYCKTCASKVVSKVILTTTPAIEGYVVEDYFGLESIEFVIGSGLFTEVGGDWADFWGMRSKGFESKLHEAKTTAVALLKTAALDMGGNAVIGVDMDYAEFSGNRVALILNGTVVRIRQDQRNQPPTDT